MASFISPSQKVGLQAVMTNIHDTFKRTLKAFKEGKLVVLSTNVQYSHVYKQPIDNATKQTVERDIEARVYYFPKKMNQQIQSATDLTLTQDTEEVRLKISTSDYNFVKDCDRFVLDGFAFEKASPPRPNGLFDTGFYTVYLRRVG